MRNIGCLTVYWALIYLCAPVSYVGTTHANLLKELGCSDTVSNLPSAVYQWLIVVPIVAAWWFPQPRYLKPLALIAIALKAIITAAVAALLYVGASASVLTFVVIAHGAAFGMASGMLMTVQWDLVKRGISPQYRGRFLSAAFGLGPVFACLGALFQDGLFDGKLLTAVDSVFDGSLFGGRSFGLPYPSNYCALFGAVAPLLLVESIAIALYRLPDTHEPAAEENTTAAEIKAGLRQFIGNRIVWYAVLLYVLVYSGGNAILSNVSLQAQSETGDESNTLGIQTLLRFGAKAVIGFLLGFLLSRANPRAPLLATTGLLLAGMAWALGISGDWFLACFGLLGAGELFGAYFPNYITAASKKRFVRINLAYMNVLGFLVGFSALAFGLISDWWGRTASFYVASGMLLLAIVLIVQLLPAQPEQRD
ncbi:MAG: hypothetical protein JNG89_11865 [Planctomycetaceae bacterium]|nr:hypothetical protein [Planctomycetaceae bacterium]